MTSKNVYKNIFKNIDTRFDKMNDYSDYVKNNDLVSLYRYKAEHQYFR